MQRRIFGPKRDEVTGSWWGLHNEDLHNLYSSPSIIRMIKSRRMILAVYVARMRSRGMHMVFDGKGSKKESSSNTKAFMVG
jgi:hypothetical protein